jgi:hypothetical protein
MAGVVAEEVPRPALADGMDVHGRGHTVNYFHSVHAAQARGLAYRLRHQVLVHRVLGKWIATYIQMPRHGISVDELLFMCVLQGLACNGFTVFVQLWCTEKKGPVFVTMFNPLSTIMVAILAYFIFGQNLYCGR